MRYLKVILTIIAILLTLHLVNCYVPLPGQAQTPGVQDVNITQVGGRWVIGYLPINIKAVGGSFVFDPLPVKID